MKNYQKGFVTPLLITVVALLVIGGGVYFYLQTKSQQVPQEITTDNEVGSTSTNQINTATSSTENAIGLIKSVYTKSGKNYLDIDYVEFVPGGPNGDSMKNDNPKIRTFEISDAINITTVYKYTTTATEQKLHWETVSSTPMNWTDFYRYFNMDNSALKSGPYRIEIKNNIVTKINQVYRP